MGNPFAFGKAVEGAFFTDRREDTRRLNANLTHGINTIIISPRRWGKTSLVKKVMSEIDDNEIKMVYIDIFSCKSEYEFYHTFATEVIKQTSSKFDEWIAMGKSFLSSITPKFSFGSDPMNDFSISFEWNEKTGSEHDILQLPERIANEKHVKVVVCIDEFQQIAEFNDAITIQKKLRTVWQHQQNTTYCLFGSKKHLMTKLFSDKSCPFFKFGDIMFLEKIDTKDWVSFITEKFELTGKKISESQATRICNVAENMSSYVQHLSWLVWYESGESVTDEGVEKSVDKLLDQNSIFFQREIEPLTELQTNFLKAIANGISTGFGRKDILRKYNLESSANVAALKKSLIAKDIIDIYGDEVVFNDPLLKLWIKRLQK